MIKPVTIRRPIGDKAPRATLYYGADCRESLRQLPENSIHTVVTSPPYWGLRDYGTGDAQIGLEKTPEDFVEKLVEVFREVHRVLRDDGTLWLNLGDSYISDVRKGRKHMGEGKNSAHNVWHNRTAPGLKPKDLVGIPWRVALALQADGWYLRSEIIWEKANPMPESIKDRVTRSHEQIFMLTKQPKYYYDQEAVKEPLLHPNSVVSSGFGGNKKSGSRRPGKEGKGTSPYSGNAYDASELGGRNKRSVWRVATKAYRGAHFAVFPPALVEPCILAGCPLDGTVLDPFSGSATTGLVALDHGRNYVGLDLNEEYLDLARSRLLGEGAASHKNEAEDEGILGMFGASET